MKTLIMTAFILLFAFLISRDSKKEGIKEGIQQNSTKIDSLKKEITVLKDSLHDCRKNPPAKVAMSFNHGYIHMEPMRNLRWNDPVLFDEFGREITLNGPQTIYSNNY